MTTYSKEHKANEPLTQTKPLISADDNTHRIVYEFLGLWWMSLPVSTSFIDLA